MSTQSKKNDNDKKEFVMNTCGEKPSIEDLKEYAQYCSKKKRREYENQDFEKTGVMPSSLLDVNLQYKEMAQLKIPAVALSVLCGTALGDGGLTKDKGYANARFTYIHSTRQSDWFFWKTLGALRIFVPLDTSAVYRYPDGMQTTGSGKINSMPGEILGKWVIRSQVNDKLTSLWSIISVNGKKTIDRRWLNHMNNYFWMSLWIDDGSLMNQTQGVFCLNSTPEDELKILSNYLFEVWDVRTIVTSENSKATPTNPEPYSMTFCNTIDLCKFLLIIAPIIPVKSMLYKVCYFHSDSTERQRWTSDLKNRIREEWHDYIDEFYLGIAALKRGHEIVSYNKCKELLIKEAKLTQDKG